MHNQTLRWGGRHHHSYHLFVPFAKLQLLWVSTRKSHFLEAEKKNCSTLFSVWQTCPFCQPVLEKKPDAMALLSSHPFWEALHTASPHRFKRLQSVAITLLMEDPMNSSLPGTNILSMDVVSDLFP